MLFSMSLVFVSVSVYLDDIELSGERRDDIELSGETNFSERVAHSVNRVFSLYNAYL